MKEFSRREFLQRFVPDIKNPEQSGGDNPEAAVSRRDFLKIMGGLCLALTSGAKETEAGEERRKTATEGAKGFGAQIESYLKKTKDNYNALEDQPVAETLVERGLLTAGQLLSLNVFQQLGFIDVPESDEFEKWRNKDKEGKIIEALAVVGVSPHLEEILFRALPSEFLAGRKAPGSKEKRLEIGIPIAALFSFGHPEFRKNITNPEFLKRFAPVSLSRFVSGVFYWYLMREKGYSHAVLAHQMHNAGILGLTEMLSRAYPKKE